MPNSLPRPLTAVTGFKSHRVHQVNLMNSLVYLAGCRDALVTQTRCDRTEGLIRARKRVAIAPLGSVRQNDAPPPRNAGSAINQRRGSCPVRRGAGCRYLPDDRQHVCGECARRRPGGHSTIYAGVGRVCAARRRHPSADRCCPPYWPCPSRDGDGIPTTKIVVIAPHSLRSCPAAATFTSDRASSAGYLGNIGLGGLGEKPGTQGASISMHPIKPWSRLAGRMAALGPVAVLAACSVVPKLATLDQARLASLA